MKLKSILMIGILVLVAQTGMASQMSQLQLKATAADSEIPLDQHNAPHFVLVIEYQLYNPTDKAISLDLDPAALAELHIEGLSSMEPLLVKADEENIKLPLIIAAKQTLKLKGSSIIRATEMLGKDQAYTMNTRLLVKELNNTKINATTPALVASFDLLTK